MDRLAGKIAIITGGGSGIGEAISLRFGREGAKVAILDVNLESAGKIAEKIVAEGGSSKAYACDVSDSDAVAEVFSSVEDDMGGLDTLVNNAGIAHIGTVEEVMPDDFDRIYSVNVKGVYNCLRSGVPLLKKGGGGAIVNMASIASTTGIPDRFAYSASKGAVVMMTRSVAVDYIRDGIRCNCISPARVHTPFVDGYLARTYPGKEEEMFKKLSDVQPMGRMGEPEEIASLALFLVSDESAFITGADYLIDGGFNNLRV
jgi:NAD(P)-dependent dehydrogenase (short-subunit alcohol dehydrogenase family)